MAWSWLSAPVHGEARPGHDDDEVRDELVTLLFAGHETTATALAWAFNLLLHNPRVLGRLPFTPATTVAIPWARGRLAADSDVTIT